MTGMSAHRTAALVLLLLIALDRGARAQVARQPTILQADDRISLKFPREVPVIQLYSALGKALGVNMLFQPRLAEATLAVDLDDVSPLRALQVMMQRGRHFYSVLDDESIFLVSDTPQNRRTFEDQALIAFVLEHLDARKVMARLRAEIDIDAEAAPRANLLLARGTLRQLHAAGRFIKRNDRAARPRGDLATASPSPPPAPLRPDPRRPTPRFGATVTEPAESSGSTVPPAYAPRSEEPIDLNFSEAVSVLDIYRAFGKAFGVNVLFDRRVSDREIAIALTQVTFGDALTVLNRAAGHFSVSVDHHTVLIADDTPYRRRLYQHNTLRIFDLDHLSSREALRMLRALIGLVRVAAVDRRWIAMLDSVEKGEIAAWIIDLVDRAGAEVSLDVEVLERDHGAEIAADSCLTAEELERLRRGHGVRALWRRAGLHVTGDREITSPIASKLFAGPSPGLELRVKARVYPRSRDVTLSFEARGVTDVKSKEAPSSLQSGSGETCLVAGLLPRAPDGSARLLALTPRVLRPSDLDGVEREMLWIGTEGSNRVRGTGPRLEPLIPGPFIPRRSAAGDGQAQREAVEARLRERFQSLPRGLESAEPPASPEVSPATSASPPAPSQTPTRRETTKDIRRLPAIDLEVLGVFGVPDRLIALLKGDDEPILAMEGHVVEERFIVHRIAPRSVSFHHVGFPDSQPRVFLLGREGTP